MINSREAEEGVMFITHSKKIFRTDQGDKIIGNISDNIVVGYIVDIMNRDVAENIIPESVLQEDYEDINDLTKRIKVQSRKTKLFSEANLFALTFFTMEQSRQGSLKDDRLFARYACALMSDIYLDGNKNRLGKSVKTIRIWYDKRKSPKRRVIVELLPFYIVQQERTMERLLEVTKNEAKVIFESGGGFFTSGDEGRFTKLSEVVN